MSAADEVTPHLLCGIPLGKDAVQSPSLIQPMRSISAKSIGRAYPVCNKGIETDIVFLQESSTPTLLQSGRSAL